MNRIQKLWIKFRLYIGIKGKKYHFLSKERARCFVMIAADYGNLGDCAITEAQTAYLRKRLPDYEIIDVAACNILDYMASVRKQSTKDDIVTTIGGGNMGNLYFDLELMRLLTVKYFPANRLISFPQSIILEEGKECTYLKKLSRRIYSSHSRLTLLAREEKSLSIMKDLYKDCDVRLAPDIVLSLDERKSITRDHSILFCLRDDAEKNDEAVKISKKVQVYADSKEYSVEYADTHIGGRNLDSKKRRKELNILWDRMRRAELIVTDRLHGMIFAFITGTPALILPNNNHKIKGSFQWIEDCGYIRLLNADDDISKAIENLQFSDDKFSEVHNRIMTALDSAISL